MNRIKRGFVIFCTAAIALSGTGAVPARAVTVTKANALSKADTYAVVDGIYSGICSMEWLEDTGSGKGDAITKKQTVQLGKDLSRQLSGKLHLKKDKSFKKIKYNKTMKRQDVIGVLYNSVGQYKLPGKLNKAKKGSVTYFVKRGILSKNRKKQYLNKKCTVSQAAAWASRLYTDIMDAKSKGSKGFFWKASKGSNTVYLLGSIHVGTTDMYPLSKKIRNAFLRSDSLYVECNVNTQQGTEDYLNNTMYTDGTTIKNHVSAKTYEELTKVCKKYNLNQEVVDQLKPWVIASSISSYYQFNTDSPEEISMYSELGVDNYFMYQAEVAGIPIRELETVTGQLDIFDSMTSAEQEEYLNYYMDKVLYSSQLERQLVKREMEEMWNCWINGDYETFQSLFIGASDTDSSDSNTLDEKLTGDRDDAMAEKIADMLDADDGKTYFVVMGSAHIETDGLVVDQLKERGYAVSRMK